MAPEPLTAAHDVASFACGKPALDRWLRTRALANQEKGFTVVMVVHEAGRVVGYYGLAPTAVLPATMPRSIRSGQPPSPVPCLLLGQLATDVGWAGRGIGTGLLADALRRCVAGAALIGGRAVVVNALDEEAARFWVRRGFSRLRTIRWCCSARCRTWRNRWQWDTLTGKDRRLCRYGLARSPGASFTTLFFAASNVLTAARSMMSSIRSSLSGFVSSITLCAPPRIA